MYLLVLLGLYIHTQVLRTQSFVEHASHSQEAVRTAKRFGFPEGLGEGGLEEGWGDYREKEGGNGSKRRRVGGLCGTVETEATLSQERSSFDLIIWEGQSAFVDEESL